MTAQPPGELGVPLETRDRNMGGLIVGSPVERRLEETHNK